MISRFFRGAVPLLILALTGCAAMDHSQCVSSDWHTVGFEDGARGHPMTKIGDYRRACAKYSVAPDFEAYRAGHSEGVELYCREGNGFNVGSRGDVYHAVCPPEYEQRFLAGYHTGRQLYELSSAVESAERRLASKRRALEEARRRLVEMQAAVIDKETSEEERAKLIVEIADSGHQQGRLESEIGALERELGARQEELNQFRASLTAYYD